MDVLSIGISFVYLFILITNKYKMFYLYLNISFYTFPLSFYVISNFDLLKSRQHFQETAVHFVFFDDFFVNQFNHVFTESDREIF